MKLLPSGAMLTSQNSAGRFAITQRHGRQHGLQDERLAYS
jgi:hypothetical protein